MRLRLALREILHNRRFSAAFTLNLALGLSGFVLLSVFHGAVIDSFAARSKALLTADLSISARRELTAAELASAEQVIARTASGVALEQSNVRELYSMAATAQGTRLVEIAAIESNYPLYGELTLRSGKRIESNTSKDLLAAAIPKLWIAPELAIQMKLQVGDRLKLGDVEFEISDIVEQDASTGWRGFSLAPRVYIGMPQLERTKLVRVGSTLNHQRVYRFAQEPDLEALARELNRVLTDPGIRVTTHRTAGEQMARALSYLSDYLGLVALVGLFLAALGSAYLFQSYLSRRLKEIATLISLGLPHVQAIGLYVLQATILGTSGALLATAVAWAAMPLVAQTLASQLGLDLSASIGSAAGIARWVSTIGLALFAAIAASVLVCLPLSVRIRTLKPGTLFQESATPTLGWNRAAVLALVPVLLAFYGLSVWQSHSFRIGSLFFGGFLVSSAVLAGVAHLLLHALGNVGSETDPRVRVPLRYLARNRLAAVSAFLAIGLGSLLITLLPQLQRNIEAEIARPEVSVLPSLFLFDIQEEQVTRIQELMKQNGVGLLQISPMVRARLEAINDQPFEKPQAPNESLTREGEQEARSRNRSYNLTYRDELTEAERIVEGRPFQKRANPDSSAEPEISVEFRFADRLGVKVGDKLTFDVQGIPVSGRIVNLRKVRWTSFQPNFFIQFQSGALEDAPKSFLATVPKLDPEKRADLQNQIVRELNNVSIIDVSSVISRGLGVFEQMAFALKAMAILSVLTGLIVLFSIANHQARTRQSEIQLLKILGSRSSDVARMFWIEFGSIGFLGSLLGAGLSVALSYGVSVQIFDSAWDFSWALPLACVAAVTALTVATTQLAAFRSLRKKPALLLGSE